jgi:hypothetical protein
MFFERKKDMTKEELIKLGLTEEQAVKIVEEYKTYIPKARFDEVNEAKKNAEALIAERDQQLETLKKSTGDVEQLKASIKQLQDDNAAAKSKYDADLKTMQIDNAVERALLSSGARNTKAVKALLDLSKAELEGEGVKGLMEQVAKLKSDENSKFLFKEEIAPAAQPAGMTPAVGAAGAPKTTKDMTYSDWVATLSAQGQ